MKKLCLDCGTVFTAKMQYDYYAKGQHEYCPIESCGGELIEVDDNMTYIIKTLNDKGYGTTYCCGAHAEHLNVNTYIMFKDDIDVHDIDMPKGFVIEANNIIRYKVTEEMLKKSGKHPQYFINIANNILLDWVDKLEEIYF